ncbi:hypothetical protein D3C72_2200690 [compost metagenome]
MVGLWLVVHGAVIGQPANVQTKALIGKQRLGQFGNRHLNLNGIQAVPQVEISFTKGDPPWRQRGLDCIKHGCFCAVPRPDHADHCLRAGLPSQ